MHGHSRRSVPPIVLLGALIAAAGCSGGQGQSIAPIIGNNPPPTSVPVTVPTATPIAVSSATPTPVPTATPTPVSTATPSSTACQANAATANIGAAGGTISTAAGSGTLTETFAASQFQATTAVSLGYIAQAGLPAPLARARFAGSASRSPMFTAGAGNTYVAAFCTSFSNAPASGVALSGSGIATSLASGTQLNIAINQNNTWVDVGTAVTGANGAFTSSAPTVALPGITKTGSYLVYVPAAGTNTAQINLGFALLADDGSANTTNGLQFVQVEDPSGNAYPTPQTTFFPVPGSDLDGQSLTPDASRGAEIDGGNNVYFFSGIPQHTFMTSTTPISVGNYGGDGDSIASLPNGDQVIISGDNGAPLAVISGILSGSPVISDTVSTNNALRDGLVISNDGTVLLSRGSTGIDVYKVVAGAAHAGSTGMGTTKYTFTLLTTLASGSASSTIPSPYLEDGRDGMAISPVDATRAVVGGVNSSSAPVVVLLTGLNTSTPTVQSVAIHTSGSPSTTAVHPTREPSGHRAPFAATLPANSYEIYAVTISPNGQYAYVSTNAGIYTFSGVNTGTLTQVGGVYSPTITAGTTSQPLMNASTIGVLPDGKYLVASINSGYGGSPGTTLTTQSYGVIVTIPIGANGVLGNPVGQLNQAVQPSNDQMILH